MTEIIDFFRHLFDTSDWPARWHCGTWTEFHGWLYIISDLLIWGAYFAIPAIILKYLSKKRDQRFLKLYFLFAGFIVSCGTTHFLDAVAFWEPAYRLNALVRAITAVVSWATIYHLIKILPHAFALKTPGELEKEIVLRKQAEEELSKRNRELAESRDILHKVFDHASVGKAVVDMHGNWLDVNPALCHMLGYEKEELMQLNFRQLTHPEDMANHREQTARLLKGEIETFRIEKRYLRKDGSVLWILLSVSLVRENDQPGFFISQMVDISANKKLIAALGEKNTTLQINLAQLNEFNRIISHNLRNPAISLVSISDFIEQSQSEEDKMYLLGKVKEVSVTLLSTLDDLKAYVEMQLNRPLNEQHSQVKKLLEKSKKMLAEEILKSRAVITEQLDVNEVIFPEPYLESILYNLMSNALKYNDPGKTPEIQIHSYTDGTYDFITVCDKGPGIDLEKHGDDLFKYKRTFHEGYESNGLGLFMTKNQVNAYGGEINVTSMPGKGACFSVKLKKDNNEYRVNPETVDISG